MILVLCISSSLAEFWPHRSSANRGVSSDSVGGSSYCSLHLPVCIKELTNLLSFYMVCLQYNSFVYLEDAVCYIQRNSTMYVLLQDVWMYLL